MSDCICFSFTIHAMLFMTVDEQAKVIVNRGYLYLYLSGPRLERVA